MNNNVGILKFLVCSFCKSNLQRNKDELICIKCSNKYLIKNGIPDMVKFDSSLQDKFRISSESLHFDNYGDKKRGYHFCEEPEYCRILDLMALKEAKKEQESLLSIGCGSVLFEKELLNRGYDVYGIDLSMSLLVRCSFSVARADALNLPFANGSFKNIFCGCVLHHIPVELHKKVIKEILRTLSPNGKFYAFEPKTTFHSLFSKSIFKLLRITTMEKAQFY